MNLCPNCGQPVGPRRRPGTPRTYCTRTCANIGLGIRRQGQPGTPYQYPPIDPVVIHRLTTGHPVTANSSEHLEAVRILTNHGYSTNQIANLMRVTPRTVTRCRAKLTNRKAA
jgi:hypothetical protein